MGFCALLRTDRFLTVAEERRAVGGGGKRGTFPKRTSPAAFGGWDGLSRLVANSSAAATG